MVALDWLHQLRQSRRLSVARSQRRSSLSAVNWMEVLEPRSLLSAMTSNPAVDEADEEAAADESEALSAMGPFAYDSMDSPYFSQTQLRDYLLNLAEQRWSGLFGQTIPQYENGYPWYLMDDVVYAMDAVPVASKVAASSSITSDTNTQVSGVDEADFVETDGRYLYVSRGGGLTILDTLDGLSVTSELELPGNVVGEFLSGDRLTVITQSSFSGWYGGPMAAMRIADFAPWGGGNWNPQTTVIVFDVSDRTAPSVVDQTTLDGNFRDARAVDGTVYVVLENSFNLPEPLYTDTPVTPDDGTSQDLPVDDVSVTDERSVDDGELKIMAMPVRWGWWNPTITANRSYESFDDYVARVGDQITSLSLPHAFSVDADGNSTDLGTLTSAESIVQPQSKDQQSLLTVVSIDATNASTGSAVASSASLLTSYGSTVYMTPDALYVATTEYHYDQSGYSSDTRIDRFTVDGTNVTWQASGVVSGTLINQFAMDEQDGYLHVATHTFAQHWEFNDSTAGNFNWSNWTTRNDNGVYVLDTEGNTLDEVGSVTGLAPGEQLFAARFIGDTAYLVTFLQVDPLFVIDLSDPTNPTVQGELKIPGFSNYLHPVGDGQLIGLGQERVPGTWFTQLQVSLFDVTDGSSPQQLAREYLGGETGWGWSEAQYDHHALLYSTEDGLLVLPFATSGTDADGNWFYEQSLAVLHVDPANGIKSLGTISSDQSIVRTVRIDNVLYAISDTNVTAYSLDDLSQIGQADLFVTAPWYYRGGIEVPVLTLSNGTGASPETMLAIPAVARLIAMPVGPVGNDGVGGAMSILANAAQVAQNTANNLTGGGAPIFAANTGLTAFDQGSIQAAFVNSAPDDSSHSDRAERSEVSSESSGESDGPSFDEFWKEFTQRLRNGNVPMPTDDAAPSNSETPMNADKAASKTEAPNARSATEGRQATERSPEMSQRVRPVQRGTIPIITVRAVTKTAAVKTTTKTPAR